MINKTGIGSKAFWLTIIQNFFMEFLARMEFSKKIFDGISKKMSMIMRGSQNKTKKTDKMSNLIPAKSLYQGIKTEFEIYSISIYFLLISSKYYDYCMTNLVDCLGRPIYSISTISSSHFLLVMVVLSQTGLDFVIFELIQKRWGSQNDKS